ncbi:MAG: hypothetical protein GYB64_02850 [Chloroflexi bacterium]|nr:hypothetical protein [Chloroflexota bacterium]
MASDLLNILNRAWQALRTYPYLAVVGIVIVLVTGQGGGLLTLARPLLPQIDALAVLLILAQGGDLNEVLAQPGITQILEGIVQLSSLTFAQIFPLLIAIFSVALLGLTIALLADGTLIAAADSFDQKDQVSLREALQRGWRNGWNLFLLASVPATPVLVTMISLAISLLAFLTARQTGNLTQEAALEGGLISLGVAVLLLIPFGLVTLVFETLRTLANRACLLEGYRFLEAYRRAWQVVKGEPGLIVLMFITRSFFAGIISTALVLPGLIVFCVPLLWVVNGAAKTYFGLMWTLTWNTASPQVEKHIPRGRESVPSPTM